MSLSNFEQISNERQELLSAQFSDLLCLDRHENVLAYERLAFSVFDKWLNADEARELLNEVKSSEEKRRYELLNRVNIEIANTTECLTYEVVGDDASSRVNFIKLLGADALSNYFKQSNHSSSSRFHFKIVLPELDALYYEGFDFTNYLYYKDRRLVESLIESVQELGLHVLN